MGNAPSQAFSQPGVVKDPGMSRSVPHGSREISRLAIRNTGMVRIGKASSHKPMMDGREKSDPCVVAMKRANKGGRPPAEFVERRRGTEGNVAHCLGPAHGPRLHVPSSHVDSRAS